ncbi:hypothetical protein LTR10_021798 [Elasticomyces elasticus]|nr:hypothetical protein LTR10_021798 [Elasticomyces elasticus]
MVGLWRALRYPDSIRLLQFPNKCDNNSTPPCTLHFNLITTRLSSPTRPQYQALSYAWGQDTTSHTITINGVDASVRQNLWDFLCPAMYGGIGDLDIRGRYLWIDALCIAQTDLEEKAHQVMQMGEIFKTAESVIVWLGPDEHDNDDVDDDEEPDEDRLTTELVICFGKRILASHKLWHRPTKADIDLNNAVLAWLVPPGSGPCGIVLWQTWRAQKALFPVAKDRMHWYGGSDILRMFSDYSENECSVTSDKVYALVNIVNRQARIPLQVDYTIDEVMLFYRTLTRVRKVHFDGAESLRRSLKITEDRLVKSTCQLLRAGMLSEITIEACFVFERFVGDNWHISKRYNLRNPSILHDNSILHSGSVEPEDIVIRFGNKSSLYLIFWNNWNERVAKGMMLSPTCTGTPPLGSARVEGCPRAFADLFCDFGPKYSRGLSFVKDIGVATWLALSGHLWGIDCEEYLDVCIRSA